MRSIIGGCRSWEPGWSRPSTRAGSAFPSRGGTVGVARSFAGGWGRWPADQWDIWDVSPLGRALVAKLAARVGQRRTKDRCEQRRRVCRRIGRATGPRRSWPWRWWGGHAGHLKAGWVATDDARRRPGRAWRPWGCGTAGRSVRLYRDGRRTTCQCSGVPARPCDTVSAGPWSSAARRPGV